MSAAILAGGTSRRMGKDKALLELGGQQVISRIIDTVGHIASDVMVIGDRPALVQPDVRVIPDDAKGYGPLGGIATALRHACHDFVLVVACDMPLLSLDLLLAMAREPRSYKALVPRLPDESGRARYEPLHAVYGVSCLPVIDELLSSGEARIQDAIRQIDIRVLDVEWLRAHDPSLGSFVNMNTPADLQRVRERLGKDSGSS